jgi:hypothetical protein
VQAVVVGQTVGAWVQGLPEVTEESQTSVVQLFPSSHIVALVTWTQVGVLLVAGVQTAESTVQGLPSSQFTGEAWQTPVVALQTAGLHGLVVQTLRVKVQFPPAQESTVHGLLSLHTTGVATHEPVVVLHTDGEQGSVVAHSNGVNTQVALTPTATQVSFVQGLLSLQV